MQKNKIGVVGLGAVAVVFLSLPGVALAANAACSTQATIGSYGGTQGTGVGCWETDQTFSNFSASGAIGTGQSTSTVDILGSESGTYPTTGGWNTTATFSGTTTWSFTGSGGATSGATVDYLSNLGQGELAIQSGYTAPTAGDFLSYKTASLAATGTDGTSATDGMTVTELICIGNVACTTATGVTLTEVFSGSGDNTGTGACSIGGSVTAGEFKCGATGSASVSFLVAVQTLTVDNSFIMSVHTATTDTLNSFADIFTDQEAPAPEPSTFVLLGTALVGLGVAGVRRRKSRSSN